MFEESKVGSKTTLHLTSGHTNRDDKIGEDGARKEEEHSSEEGVSFIGLVTQWARNSSANGIPSYERSDGKLRKLIWLILVLTGAGLTVLQVYEIFETFYEYPVSISVNLTYASSLDFPSVTICNNNIIRKSKLWMASDALSSILPYSYGLTTNTSNLQSGYERAVIRNEFDIAWATINDSTREAMGHQAQDMILDCLYGGEACSRDDFATHLNPFYGVCHTFNSNTSDTHVSHRAGPFYGLTLELYIEQDEYIPELTEAAGVRVLLHHQDVTPFPEDNGVLVAPGMMTLLGSTLLDVRRLPKPFISACWDLEAGDAIYNSVFSEMYGHDYSLSGCQKSCYQLHVIGDCLCGDPVYPLTGYAVNKTLPANFTGTVQPCSSADELRCENLVKHSYLEGNLDCNCSISCQAYAYEMDISFGSWPASQFESIYYSQLATRNPHLAETVEAYNNGTGTEPSDSLVKLLVFYEQFNYEIIEEVEAYPISQFLSDLGGAIGFYLGVSIIACFEFFELVVDFLLLIFWKFGAHYSSKKSDRVTSPIAW